MYRFDKTTTLPFPFIKSTYNVTSTEVDKPNGIAYIILVLLNEVKDRSLKWGDILKNSLNISSTFYSIFADEVADLIAKNIITCQYNYSKDYFEQYELTFFDFTLTGKKVFREGMMLTDKKKQNRIGVYYNVVMNELSLKVNSYYEIKKLENGAFDEDFCHQFDIKQDIEDFLNSQKGKGFVIKEKEVITKIDPLLQEFYVGKFNVRLVVDNDKIDFVFDNKLCQDFMNEYYNKDIINKAISNKSKFNFKNIYEGSLSELDETKVYAELYASEYRSELSYKHNLIIKRSNLEYKKNGLIYESDNLLDKVSTKCECILVEDHRAFGYYPLRLRLNNKNFGEIILPICIKVQMDLKEVSDLLDEEFKNELINDEYDFTLMNSLFFAVKDYMRPLSYLKNSFGTNNNTNMVTLIKEKDYFKDYNVVNHYNDLLKEQYYKCLSNINEVNLETTLNIISNVLVTLKIKKNDLLNEIMNHINPVKNVLDTYKILEKVFDTSLLVSYLNPFKEVYKLDKIDPNSSLINIIRFKNNINSLKDITGVKNLLKIKYDADDIVKDDFINEYNSMLKQYKTIQIFKNMNENEFKEFDEYIRIYKNINDYYNLINQAIKNPKNIKKSLIEEKINKGDYQFVLVNLSAKLSYILKSKYEYDGKLYDQLKLAKKNSIIDNGSYKDLSYFKECRNNLAHPSDENIDNPFDANDLRRWCDLVFRVEEDSKNE